MNLSATLSTLSECSICYDIIREPQICTSCTHGFHSECLQKWLETHSTCPCCRAYNITTRNLTNVERECLQIQKLKCSHCKQEFHWPYICDHELSCDQRPHECLCGQEMSFEKLPEHISKCSAIKKLKTCCFYCNKRIPRTKYSQHLNQCEYNVVQCTICNEEIAFGKYISHIKECIHNVGQTCPLCSNTISYADYQLHVQSCVEKFYREIECVFCRQKYNIENIKEHLERCDKNLCNQIACIWCQEVVSADLLKNHINNCSSSTFATIYCPWCKLSALQIGVNIFPQHIKGCNKQLIYCTDCGTRTKRIHSSRCSRCNQMICSKCHSHHPDVCPSVKKIFIGCCKQYIPLMHKEAHEESCPKSTIKCRYCQQLIIRGIYKQHLLTDCPDVYLNCKACGIKYRRIEQASHLQKCEQQFFCKYCCSWVTKHAQEFHDKKLCIVHCSECNCIHQTVKLKICEYCQQRYCHRQSHQHGDDCSQKSITCSVCGIKLLQKDLQDHQKNCQTNTELLHTCEYCKVRIKANDKFNHYGKCTCKVNRKCTKCGIIVHKRFINAHNCTQTNN